MCPNWICPLGIAPYARCVDYSLPPLLTSHLVRPQVLRKWLKGVFVFPETLTVFPSIFRIRIFNWVEMQKSQNYCKTVFTLGWGGKAGMSVKAKCDKVRRKQTLCDLFVTHHWRDENIKSVWSDKETVALTITSSRRTVFFCKGLMASGWRIRTISCLSQRTQLIFAQR